MTDYTQIPENFGYTKNHEWIKQDDSDSDDIFLVGITYHAQEALGDIVHIEMPSVGSEFSAGDEIAVVESAKSASEIYAPISGKIIEVNDALDSNPENINESPYDLGWIVKIQADDPDEFSETLSADGYNNFLEEEA